ncbi:hypothetical protein CRUP_008572 [Coryphaenoides rupestris]|nr:hypothetical protein CRUP_008572 [Coryphaenoides rupestris]
MDPPRPVVPASHRHEADPCSPWARFLSWLECVCVVTFDLELGQAIELVYPHDAKLTEKEKTSICYLSFPDSYSGCLGDTQFSFRFRQSIGRKSSNIGEDAYNRDAPVTLQCDMGHFYGYVYFRQVKDVSVKRGYFQKSLVLVSRLPYVHLFHTLLQVIAPEYFEKLEPCLEAVCNEIDQWPSPVAGMTLNLPVMGAVLQVRIPSKTDKPASSTCTDHAADHSRVGSVQVLWELTLLGEPVVVMAPSPTMSSEIVLALVSSIAPLKYCSDFRPYFTIHDSEFREYTTRTQAPMAGDLPKQVKVKKLAKLKTLDTKPGHSAEETVRGAERHFATAPERYMASLMPLQRSVTPWKTPPQIRPFSQEEFVATLEHAGPHLTSMLKGDWMGLYRRFFRSPNFDGWYRLRRREMTQKLECLHLEAVCDADLVGWTKDKSEVEVVDLVLKLREKLTKAHGQQLSVKDGALDQLEACVWTIAASLPEDLQTVLRRHRP